MHIFMCVCVCVIVCNQCLYKGGGTQECLTAVLFPGVIFQQRPWPRLLLRGAKKDALPILAGFPAIGCETPLPRPWFIFSVLHKPMAVQLLCIIKKRLQYREKKEFPLAS